MYDKTASDAKTNDSKPGFLAVYKSTGPILRSTKHHLFHATRREVSTKGVLGACSPRTFLKLYPLKRHFLSSNKKQFSRQALVQFKAHEKQSILNADDIKEHIVIKKHFVMFRGRAHNGLQLYNPGHFLKDMIHRDIKFVDR